MATSLAGSSRTEFEPWQQPHLSQPPGLLESEPVYELIDPEPEYEVVDEMEEVGELLAPLADAGRANILPPHLLKCGGKFRARAGDFEVLGCSKSRTLQ